MDNGKPVTTRSLLTTTVPAVIVSLILICFSACSVHSESWRKGTSFYHEGDYDQAVTYLEKAYKEKSSRELHLMLFQAKLNSYYQHVALARTYKEAGKKEEAIKEYRTSLAIFPNNTRLEEEMNAFIENRKSNDAKPFVSSIKPPVTLDIDSREKMSVKLNNTPITKIFKVVGKSYGVNFIFDKDFRDFVYSIDIEQIGFYDIVNQLCMVGGAEYRILDRTSVLIYPNTPFKKRSFSLKGVKVFYLSNIKADDAKKLLMSAFREHQLQLQEDTNLNSVIIKGDYTALLEVERFIASIDKRKSEVMIDVEVLEVTKNLIKAIGMDYGDSSTPLSKISAGHIVDTTDNNGNVTSSTVETTVKFSELKNTSFFLTVPSAALNFLQSDDKNRIMARPNLRGVDGEEIKFMVGDEVPVPNTLFQSSAAGGLQNVPVTPYRYRDVGVDVKLTPYVQLENEVTLSV